MTSNPTKRNDGSLITFYGFIRDPKKHCKVSSKSAHKDMNPIKALERLDPIPLTPSQDLTVRLKKLKFVSVSEAAKTLHCSQRHVLRLIDLGELHSAMDISLPDSRRRSLRIPRQSVFDYLMRNSAL